jgi:predicted glycoside hydrolase/deacetylase ChbG (UPF0249 family)
MSKIRLVTRGDDAGSSHSANSAIVESCTQGLLRNTSIMVPGPAFEEVAQVLPTLQHVDLGLHVVLNSEWDTPRGGPVAPREKVLSLLESDGNFTRTPNDLHEHEASVEEMMLEVRAQLEKARAAGLNIRYLDQHMGVGWVRGLGEELKVLCQAEGLLFADVLPGLPTANEKFDDALADLLARLEIAPQGTYVYVTHPTFDDEETRAIVGMGNAPGEVARQRDADRRLWSDARLRETCARLDVEIVRYSQVLSG